MDKKQAEEEALRKAKDTQAAAGKSSGMSGRDLVSRSFFYSSRLRPHLSASSHTTPSGSKIPMRKKRKIGTCRSTAGATVRMRVKSRRACRTWTSGMAASHRRAPAIKPSYMHGYKIPIHHDFCTLLWTVVYANRIPLDICAYYITIEVYEYIVHGKSSLVVAPVVCQSHPFRRWLGRWCHPYHGVR